MLFTRIALIALPFIGSAFASPVAKLEMSEAARVVKRDTALSVVQTLQDSVADPVTTLNTANVSEADAYSALTSILNAITTASTSITTSTAEKRDAMGGANPHIKRDDLDEVGAVLAEVIEDLVNAIEGLAVDLESRPLIGALITDIDAGLNTLLTGVEVVLEGVIEILEGLLSGVSDLLQGLGAGLLAALIFD